jgi:hypothetical protein
MKGLMKRSRKKIKLMENGILILKKVEKFLETLER